MLGERLTIKGPAGKFSCFDCPASKMLFIGAGSGITPMMSMSRWIVDTTTDVDVKFLVSFKSPADIIFRKELELISARHACFRVAVTLTSAWPGRSESWTGLTGRFDKSMIHALVPYSDQRHVFLCGPEPFAAEVRGILQELGFDQAKLHSESFGSSRVAGGGQACAEAAGAVGAAAPCPLHQERQDGRDGRDRDPPGTGGSPRNRDGLRLPDRQLRRVRGELHRNAFRETGV